MHENKMVDVTKRVIRSRKSLKTDNTMAKGKRTKDKQLSTKHYKDKQMIEQHKPH
jgi:hypothetical protein